MKERVFFITQLTKCSDSGSENSFCCLNIFYMYKIECNFVCHKKIKCKDKNKMD